MGLNPAQLRSSLELYLSVMHRPSSLSRAQREMLSIVVSAVNQCHY